jgi:hypothetical protein
MMKMAILSHSATNHVAWQGAHPCNVLSQWHLETLELPPYLLDISPHDFDLFFEEA